MSVSFEVSKKIYNHIISYFQKTRSTGNIGSLSFCEYKIGDNIRPFIYMSFEDFLKWFQDKESLINLLDELCKSYGKRKNYVDRYYFPFTYDMSLFDEETNIENISLNILNTINDQKDVILKLQKSIDETNIKNKELLEHNNKLKTENKEMIILLNYMELEISTLIKQSSIKECEYLVEIDKLETQIKALKQTLNTTQNDLDKYKKQVNQIINIVNI